MIKDILHQCYIHEAEGATSYEQWKNSITEVTWKTVPESTLRLIYQTVTLHPEVVLQEVLLLPEVTRLDELVSSTYYAYMLKGKPQILYPENIDRKNDNWVYIYDQSSKLDSKDKLKDMLHPNVVYFSMYGIPTLLLNSLLGIADKPQFGTITISEAKYTPGNYFIRLSSAMHKETVMLAIVKDLEIPISITPAMLNNKAIAHLESKN